MLARADDTALETLWESMPSPPLLCLASRTFACANEPIASYLYRERPKANKLDYAEDHMRREDGCDKGRSKRRLRTYRGAMLQEL